MVKLEGLTQEQIKNIDNKKKAEEESIRFGQLCQRFKGIAEDMFAPSLWDFFENKKKRVSAGGDFESYYLTIYLGDSSRRLITNERIDFSIEAVIWAKEIGEGYSGYSHSYIFVHDPSKNRIRVYQPNRLNEATQLARAYEEAGFGEFTVKKEYEE
ncbi:MAG: hypothetical protein AABY03_01805 [Nanoarchaeota archaeon]